ncbi:TolC family protein [Myroides phaeus]|uniref:TolC family protein n=1 Tax=Myroides phaeus TaxID=702745 RepID=UPI002DBA4267|nr:TolC family protein [Myroides phaeus]MEC4117245.1 TolC family protein [Myroides phaeus]
MMKKYLFTTAVVGVITLTAQWGYAQNTPQFSLADLWEKTEQNYVGLQAKIANVDAAQHHYKSSKTEALPQLRIQAQNSYGSFEGSNGAFFPQPGFFNVSGNPDAFDGADNTMNSFGSAVVEWEIFAFGKQKQATKATKASLNKSIADKEAYAIQLKKELTTRYIHTLYNEANLDWTQKNTNRLNEVQRITASLTAAGMKPQADSLLAHSSYLQALSQQDLWQGNKESSLIHLAELTGEESGMNTIETERFLSFSTTDQQPDTAIEHNHPFLQSLEHQSKSLMHSSKSIARSGLPSFKVLGGYAVRGSGIDKSGYVSDRWKDGFSNSVDNYLVGVGLTWNFTTLFTNKHKQENFAKMAKSVDFQKEQYSQQMQAQLASSIAKINEQQKQLQKTKQAIEQAHQAYTMYLARYKSGLIALSELLQIQSLLQQAEKTHIEASQQYWLQLVAQATLTTDFQFLFNNL